MRRVARLAVVAVALGLVVDAGTLSAQQGTSLARGRRDSLMFLLEDRIDGLGTIALISSDPDTTKPYYAELVRSAISAQLVDAIIKSAERVNTQTKDPESFRITFTRETPLRAVAQKDRARVDAIVARLRRAPRREVRGIGMQRAVAIPLHAGP